MPTLVLLAAAATAPTAQADPWWEDPSQGAQLSALPGDAPSTILLAWRHSSNAYLAGFELLAANGNLCTSPSCDHSPSVVGYEVHRSDDGGSTFQEIAVVVPMAGAPPVFRFQGVLPTTQSYADHGLDPATTYHYKVRTQLIPWNGDPADGGYWEGAFSNVASTRPDIGFDGVMGSLPCQPSRWVQGCGDFQVNGAACFLAADLVASTYGSVFPEEGLPRWLRYECGEAFGGALPKPL